MAGGGIGFRLVLTSVYRKMPQATKHVTDVYKTRMFLPLDNMSLPRATRHANDLVCKALLPELNQRHVPRISRLQPYQYHTGVDGL